MASTYQYKYISSFTFTNDGNPSGIEVWVEALGTDLPDFKQVYSLAVYETEAEAKFAIKNELDNFGTFKNGVEYPKTGTLLPGQEKEEVETEGNIKYSIIGKVIDIKTSSPILGAQVSYKTNIVNTDDLGKFVIEGEISKDEKVTLDINSEGYSPISIQPYTGDGKLKNNINVKSLKPSSSDLEDNKNELLQLNNDTVKTITKPKGSAGFQQKALNKVINNLKLLLIPTVLTLISSFGVTNITKLLEGQIPKPSCPSSDKLKRIIKQRNKLAKQLNNLYKIVDVATQALTILEGIIATTKVIFTILKFIPIPTPTPGAPSLVPPIQDVKPILEKNIDKFSKINSGTLILLLVLKENIKKILDLLSLLDNLIVECTTDVVLESINEDLLEINKEQEQSILDSQVDIPPKQIVNGFSFDIETETTTSNLKRIRAVAKNIQGIILLRGEYSYSSSDKILIDELVFYIQQNNLKAD